MDEMYYQKIQKYDIPAVREHVIRVTGETKVKFGALILDWRGQLASRSNQLFEVTQKCTSIGERIDHNSYIRRRCESVQALYAS